MCLDVLNINPYKSEDEVWAWKRLYLNQDSARTPIEFFNLEYEKYETSSDKTLWTSYENSSYPSGFHCYATFWGAYFSCFGGSIKKVKLRNIKAVGYQLAYKILVAREIFIPKPKSFWERVKEVFNVNSSS